MIYVGPPEAACGRDRMLVVDDPGDAVTALSDRYSVLLPDYDTAAEVLRRLGATEEHIIFRLRIARGELDGLPV
jgi:hypothetical protein